MLRLSSRSSDEIEESSKVPVLKAPEARHNAAQGGSLGNMIKKR
jgi:hypothetical protein